MNIFTLLRVEIVKRPIFNILVVLLALIPGSNLGWAIIALTLLIRLLLVKNAMAATDMQKSMGSFHPKMQEIQEKYADDPQKMSQEMMNLFKGSGWGPLKWCLSMIIQIPIFLGLFYTVSDIAKGELPSTVYSFLSWLDLNFEAIETVFLGIDLLEPNNIIMAILAAGLMFAQMKITSYFRPAKIPWNLGALAWGKDMPDMSSIMWNMNIVFAIMMGWFVYSVAAAVGIYIITTTLFGVVQQTIQFWPAIKAKYYAATGKPTIIEEE